MQEESDEEEWSEARRRNKDCEWKEKKKEEGRRDRRSRRRRRRGEDGELRQINHPSLLLFRILHCLLAVVSDKVWFMMNVGIAMNKLTDFGDT